MISALEIQYFIKKHYVHYHQNTNVTVTLEQVKKFKAIYYSKACPPVARSRYNNFLWKSCEIENIILLK